jgi:hypothetical protein
MSDRQHPSTLLVVGIGFVGVGVRVGFVGVDPVILVGVILVGVGFVGGALHRDRRGKVFAHNKRIIPATLEQVWNQLVDAHGWSDFYRNAHFRSQRVRRSTGGSALDWAGQLLPDAIKEDYIEEWQAWLSDLHQAGEPWYRRTAELLVIVLVAAPRLAIICRLGPHRMVD